MQTWLKEWGLEPGGTGDHTGDWNPATADEPKAGLATLPHRGGVLAVAFSPDGKTMVTGCGDGNIASWDAKTGKTKATNKGHTGWVNSVAFSPDGKTLASGSGDKTIKLWDVATGKEQATLKGHTDSVYLRGVQSGRQDAGLGRASDKTIKLWDVATGKEQATLKGHTDWVSSVAFSPDGKTLASGSDDKTIKLWDVATGKEQATLKGHTSVGVLRGVQPGRQDAGLGERGQDDQAVGRGDGQGTGHPQGTYKDG